MGKKCIFTCVFNSVKYVDMLYLLLESIYTYAHLDEDTDILVYTSTAFMNMIKQHHLYSNKIVFEINDGIDNIDKACKSRLDLFYLGSVKNYEKILYVDTDVIIRSDITPIWNMVQEDMLYVMGEGDIRDERDYWGLKLFGTDVNMYQDKTGFSTGIMAFKNCDDMLTLFEYIRQDIWKRPHAFDCYDQPYFVYNAFKYNRYDNKQLNHYVKSILHGITNDTLYSDMIIYHFPGGPGIYTNKLSIMFDYMKRIKDIHISQKIEEAKQYINQHLLPIIYGCNEPLEGNIFMLHHTTEYTNVFLDKAKNISNLVMNKTITNVMEIGFNAGFSALLMLLTNDKMRITCFDLGEHSYTMPCYNKLKETFGDRISIHIGDSTQTLPKFSDTYQLIHIDGGHSSEVAISDIVNSYRMSNNGTILIMDDYDFENLHGLWDMYIEKYSLLPLSIHVYNSPHHDVRYVVNKPSIPNTLIQTSRTKPNPKEVDMLMAQCKGWTYIHFTDDDILDFFKTNPIPDLPHICEKFHSFTHGCHKSDLFRYYYLYLKGGVYIDSDAMIYQDIHSIVKQYQFVSVNSSSHPGALFQGVLGVCPENNIIKEALYNMYKFDDALLTEDIHYACRDIYTIFQKKHQKYHAMLYSEVRMDGGYDHIIDENNRILFTHYWSVKNIPLSTTEITHDNDTSWNHYRKDELSCFDHTVLISHSVPLPLVRVGNQGDGGYVIADGLKYDRFISCGIAGDIGFEDAFLDKYGNLSCLAFDGTIDNIPPHRNNIEWVRKNIGSANSETTTNLQSYIQDYTNIFLKMDIEGSEFNWIDSMTTEELSKISQIALEVHWPFDKYRCNMLKKLTETHYIIHIHGNNYCDKDIPSHLPSGRTYDGTVKIETPHHDPIVLPEVMEITYVRKSLFGEKDFDISPVKKTFPTPLDFPNNQHSPDIHFTIPSV